MKAYIAVLLVMVAACGSAQEPLAKLTFASGDVLVNGAVAGIGQVLSQGDLIETLAGSEATITFYNSSIVRLSESTTLELSTLTEDRMVKIKQSAGETWTRVLKVTGIGEYKIETPNAVATVRGTGFKVAVQENDTEVSVGEGTVHVAKVANGAVLAEINVEANQKAVIERARSDDKREAAQQIRIEHIEMDKSIEKNLKADDEHIKKVMQRLSKDQLFDELDNIESDARKLISNPNSDLELPSESQQESAPEVDALLENLQDESELSTAKIENRTANLSSTRVRQRIKEPTNTIIEQKTAETNETVEEPIKISTEDYTRDSIVKTTNSLLI